jgi:hypothetical protein
MTKTDKERIHRWITQADLERMLDDAYAKGAEEMRSVAAQEAANYGFFDHAVNPLRDLPLPKRPA